MSSEPLKLDGSDWIHLDQACGSGASLPATVRRIAKVPDWNHIDEPHSGEDAWEELQNAVYDQGNVRSGAYGIMPHLLELAREGRKPVEQAIVLHFLLMCVFDALEGVEPIPQIVAAVFAQSIIGVAQLAKACALNRDLLRGTRSLCAAAHLLARRDLVASFVSYRAALDSLELPCEVCGASIELHWRDTRWYAEFEPSATNVGLVGAPVSGRLTVVRGLAVATDLGDDMRHIEQLDAKYECPSCNSALTVVEVVASTLRRRAPLAHLDGWRP